MKKMKKFIYVLLIATGVVGVSCSDYLDYTETDLVFGDAALKTVTNVESATIGAYGGVSDLMGVLLNSVFSDEVKTAGEFYNAATVHEWQYGPADISIRDTYTAINPQYATIDRVNRVLARVDVADSTRVGDNTLRKRLRGEALFLRAWAHFELFRFYCARYTPTGLAMPYMETPNPKLEPNARITMDEYFQKLNADISAAKALLPATHPATDPFGRAETALTRATSIACNGLHARIALYSEDWANAEAYATAFINAIPLSTTATFAGIWTDAAANTELGFRTVRTPSMARLGSLYRNTSASATNIGTVVWTYTTELYNSYPAGDVRIAAYFRTEPALTAAGRSPFIIRKYAGGNYGTGTENSANSKLLRSAEMYLIRAEARAEQGNLTGAASDLNALRTNRIPGYTPITLTTLQQAIDEIFLERYRELAFEGHRFWDLKRKSMPVTRTGTDAPTTTGTTLPADDYRFALPIPLTEMQANKLMTQNPGY
jgi:starch-binding outer membrane protein, SusD/RagB family